MFTSWAPKLKTRRELAGQRANFSRYICNKIHRHNIETAFYSHSFEFLLLAIPPSLHISTDYPDYVSTVQTFCFFFFCLICLFALVVCVESCGWAKNRVLFFFIPWLFYIVCDPQKLNKCKKKTTTTKWLKITQNEQASINNQPALKLHSSQS